MEEKLESVKNLYKKKLGYSGEDRACEYLLKNGYSIVARNFTVRGGELDIVAEKGETLVIFEVKTLPHGDSETLKKLLNTQKIKTLVRTTKHFLLKHLHFRKKLKKHNLIRFDVLALDLPGFPPVFHIENAFTEIL